MDKLIEYFNYTFTYCTDFVINCANILNLSYYEINFIIFCVIYPILLFGSFGTYVVQRKRLSKLKKQIQITDE